MDIQCLGGEFPDGERDKSTSGGRLTVGEKPLRDIFEAVDHARAYDFMFFVFGNRRVDEYTVLRMHELFYQNIEPEYAGRYRDMRVIITGSRYSVAAPEKIPEEMGRLCVWIQKSPALQ